LKCGFRNGRQRKTKLERREKGRRGIKIYNHTESAKMSHEGRWTKQYFFLLVDRGTIKQKRLRKKKSTSLPYKWEYPGGNRGLHTIGILKRKRKGEYHTNRSDAVLLGEQERGLGHYLPIPMNKR